MNGYERRYRSSEVWEPVEEMEMLQALAGTYKSPIKAVFDMEAGHTIYTQFHAFRKAQPKEVEHEPQQG